MQSETYPLIVFVQSVPNGLGVQVPDVQVVEQGIHFRRRCVELTMWSQWRPVPGRNG